MNEIQSLCFLNVKVGFWLNQHIVWDDLFSLITKSWDETFFLTVASDGKVKV